jgi:alpha-tubulin suppressor-like RCC1 family protein
MWLSELSSNLENQLVLNDLDPQVNWGTGLPFYVPVPQVSSGEAQKEVIDMALGYNWYFVVTSDLEVYMTGINTDGRLGLNSISTSQSAVLQPMETNSVLKTFGVPQSVSAGRNHAVWVTNFVSGRVYAWGSNAFYQLGNEVDAYSTTPVQILFPEDEVIVRASAVWDTSFAINAFGSVYVWGSNTRCLQATGCHEASFGISGIPSFSIASATPSRLSFPTGVYALTLPQHSIGFDTSLADPSRWETEWVVLMLGEDQNAAPVVSGPSPLSLFSWGSSRLWDGASGKDTIIPAYPNSDLIGFTGLREIFAPSEIGLSVIKACVFEDSVRVLVERYNQTLHKSVQSIWAAGRLEHASTHNFTVPFPELNGAASTSSHQHPYASVSRLVDVTAYQQVEDDLKQNISTISLSQHSLVVQSGDGRIISYNNQIGYERGDFSPRSRIECARDVCIVLDSRTQLLSSWVDHTEHDGLTYNLLGRSAASQASLSDNTVPVAIPGTNYFRFSVGDDFAIALINDTQNTLFAWGSKQVALGGAINALFEPQLVNLSLLGGVASSITPNNFVSLKAGRSHAALLLSGGTLIMWGDNTFGQVGPWYDVMEDAVGSGLFPRVVPASFIPSPGKVESVACVRDTTIVMAAAGVFAWGLNGPGYNFQSSPSLFSSFGSEQAVHIEYIPSAAPVSSGTAYSIVDSVLARKSGQPPLSFDQALATAPSYPMLMFGTDSDLENPITGYPGETLAATPILVGELPSKGVRHRIGFSTKSRFFVTDDNSVYAAGDLWTAPANEEARGPPYEKELTFGAVQPRPQLVYSYNISTFGFGIRSVQAFGEGLAILLNNGTVNYFRPAYHPTGDARFYSLLGTSSNIFRGIQTLEIEGTTDLQIRDMSCDYWTCCFRSTNRTLWCFGQITPAPPVKRMVAMTEGARDQEVAVDPPFLDKKPFLTYPESGTTALAVMTARSGFAFGKVDGTLHWATVDGNAFPAAVTSVVDITGAIDGFPVETVAAGVAHIVVHVRVLGLFVSGWNDSMAGFGAPYGVRVGTALEPLVPYYPELFNDNVLEVAAWVYSIVIQLKTGEIWYDGPSLGAVHSNWKPHPTLFPHPTYGPVLVPIDSSKWLASGLHSRRSFDEINESVLPAHFLLTAFRVSPPAPATLPPPPPPVVGCSGAPPSSNCECDMGVWRCSGRVVIAPGTVISASMDVSGDIIFNPGVTIIINPATSSFSGPLISVSGCALLEGPIELELSKETVKSMPSKGDNIIVIESSCTQSITELFTIKQTTQKCKRIAGVGSQQPVANNRQSLNIAFSVTKNTCNYWWIILVAVVGGVLILVPLTLLIFYKVGILSRLAHPFKGSNS